MDVATYRIRHKTTKQEFTVNQTDYHRDLASYAEYDRVGTTHGENDAPLVINTGEPLKTHVETLLGSSVLPAMIDVGTGTLVQLGEIVAAAHANSGLSVEAWNTLEAVERDALLTAEIDARLDASKSGQSGNGQGDANTAKFEAMTKSDLKSFAADNFKVDLDMAKTKAELVAEVSALAAA